MNWAYIVGLCLLCPFVLWGLHELWQYVHNRAIGRTSSWEPLLKLVPAAALVVTTIVFATNVESSRRAARLEQEQQAQLRD